MVTVPKKNTSQVTHPVSTTHLPVVKCGLCGTPLPHQPRKGAAAAVLTEHCNRKHADELTST